MTQKAPVEPPAAPATRVCYVDLDTYRKNMGKCYKTT